MREDYNFQDIQKEGMSWKDVYSIIVPLISGYESDGSGNGAFFISAFGVADQSIVSQLIECDIDEIGIAEENIDAFAVRNDEAPT